MRGAQIVNELRTCSRLFRTMEEEQLLVSIQSDFICTALNHIDRRHRVLEQINGERERDREKEPTGPIVLFIVIKHTHHDRIISSGVHVNGTPDVRSD